MVFSIPSASVLGEACFKKVVSNSFSQEFDGAGIYLVLSSATGSPDSTNSYYVAALKGAGDEYILYAVNSGNGSTAYFGLKASSIIWNKIKSE